MKLFELLLPILAAVGSLVWIAVRRPKGLQGITGLAFTVVAAFFILILAGAYQLYSGEDMQATFSRHLICPVLSELPGCKRDEEAAPSTAAVVEAISPSPTPAAPLEPQTAGNKVSTPAMSGVASSQSRLAYLEGDWCFREPAFSNLVTKFDFSRDPPVFSYTDTRTGSARVATFGFFEDEFGEGYILSDMRNFRNYTESGIGSSSGRTYLAIVPIAVNAAGQRTPFSEETYYRCDGS